MSTSSFRRLAALNVASNLTAPLASLIDVAFLGHEKTVAPLAGVALATVLFDVLYFSFGFLRMATTGLTAQAQGALQNSGQGLDTVYAWLYRGLLVALCSSALVLSLQLPIRYLGFALLSGEADVEQLGMHYFDIRIWAVPAAFARYVFLGWFLGRGRSGVILAAELCANLCNVGLDYLFIRQLSWGVRGAALATLISQYLSFAVLLLFFVRRPRKVAWSLVLGGKGLRALLSLSRDIFVRTLFLTATFAAFTNISAHLGTTVLAANTLLLRCLGIAAFVIDGFAYATETLIGQSKGRGDHQAARSTVREAMRSAVGTSVLCLAMLLLLGKPIFGLLTSHKDVVDTAMHLRLGLGLTLCAGAFAWVYDGVFFGLGQGKVLRNATAWAALFFACGAVFALVMRSPVILWAALVVFMSVRGVYLYFRWRRVGAF